MWLTYTYVTYAPDYEEIGLYEFRKIINEIKLKSNKIMWRKINSNNLPVGVVVARRGSVVQSGHLIITQAGMVVLVSSSPSKNRELLIEWPDAYIKILDLLELPFETSAKDILTNEIANSSSGFNGVIVHPKLADRLIEEGAISPNMLKSGYCFVQRVGTSGAVYHNVYVSSDNMKPEQVIIF